MRRNQPIAIASLLLSILLAGCGGQRHTPITSVAPDDPEMLAAIEKARSTLPEFWDVFEKRPRGEADFALKVKFTDQEESEFMWLTKLERRDGTIKGTLDNDPETVRSVKAGQRITIPEADICDWMYTRDDKIVGNSTLRAMFKYMTPGEVEECKQLLADP